MDAVIRFLEACGWARRKNAPVSRSGQQRKWESRGYKLSMANAHQRARRDLRAGRIELSKRIGTVTPPRPRPSRSRLPGIGWIARLVGIIPARRAA